MECQQENCGTVPAHHWLNTTLIMNTPDPNYGKTVRLNKVTGSLVTSNGGKTWTAADILIQQYKWPAVP
jgi:hypothetical protein